ncbi:hypothetical protein ATJ88_0695 [Isoptericola jiangsuensis]|uniref:Uncharacterized protein n=1 Tax=Isoptericola jiangsuensis TaxID=548579 RepID=A0A2A9EUY2_9MICO|nr:hypothetical protein [Isoptericola jiangsuensis]PFG42045.1 hypothetical protein ATJ88_0695 [Isoptericola jiangsuensis]
MHDDDGGVRRTPPRSVEWSLALGVAAVVCAVVPVVGDWVSTPLALLAVTLGSVGCHVADRDLRPGVKRGIAGALLGLTALAVVAFGVIAGLAHPSG